MEPYTKSEHWEETSRELIKQPWWPEMENKYLTEPALIWLFSGDDDLPDLTDRENIGIFLSECFDACEGQSAPFKALEWDRKEGVWVATSKKDSHIEIGVGDYPAQALAELLMKLKTV